MTDNTDIDQKFMVFTQGMSFMGEGFRDTARGSYILLFGLSANIMDKVSGIGSSDQRFKDVLRVLGSILLVLPVATLLTVTVLPMLAVAGIGTLRNKMFGKQKNQGLWNSIKSTTKAAVNDVQVQAGNATIKAYVENVAPKVWERICDSLFDKEDGLFRWLVGEPGPELSSHGKLGESSNYNLKGSSRYPPEAKTFDAQRSQNSGVDKQQLQTMLRSIVNAKDVNAAKAAIRECDSNYFRGSVHEKDLDALKVFAKNIQVNISNKDNIVRYSDLPVMRGYNWGGKDGRVARQAPFGEVNRLAKACYPDAKRANKPGEKSENKSFFGLGRLLGR